MITAREVHDAEFRRAAAGTPGYDEVAVDDFLDRVIATLTALEQGHGSGADAVTSHEVVEAEFPERAADVNGGYDMDDVDDLLDRVAQRLFAAETSGSNGGETLHADDEWEPASELSDDGLVNPRRDDGGVRDAAALAVASGAPRGAVQSDTRADDEWQDAAVTDGVRSGADNQRGGAEPTPERGYDQVDDSRGGSFGEPGVRVPQVRPDGTWDEEPTDETRHERLAEPGVQVPRVRPDGSWDDADEHADHEAPALATGDAESEGDPARGFLGAHDDAGAQDDHRTQRVVDAEDVAGDSERRGPSDEHVVEAGAGGRVVDDAVEGDGHAVDDERTVQQGINPVGGEPLDEAADARDEARREASQASAQVHPVGGGLAATGHELIDDEGADDDSGRDAVASADEGDDRSDEASRDVTIEHVQRSAEPGDQRAATIRPSMGQSWTGGAADDASTESAADANHVDEQGEEAQSAGEVPVVHEPVSEESIISYPATDHRVPLPRGDVRRAMSDADRQAEGHYHPEFSAYATPEVFAEPAGSEIPPIEPAAPRSDVVAEHQSEPRHLDETRVGSAADPAADDRSSADGSPAEAAMADPAAADSVLDHAGMDGGAFDRTPSDATPASTQTGATTESSPWDEPIVSRDPAVASHPSDVAADDPFADEAPVAAFDPHAGDDFDPFAQPSGPTAMTPRVPSPEADGTSRAQVDDAGASHDETPTSRDAVPGSRREASAHVGEAFESRDETSASDAHAAAPDDESSVTGNAAAGGDDEAPAPAFAALRRVAPAKEEVARVREPHDDRDAMGAPAPVAAELARRAAERERLAAAGHAAEGESAETARTVGDSSDASSSVPAPQVDGSGGDAAASSSPQRASDDTRAANGGQAPSSDDEDDAWSVGRPEPIDAAEPIDAVKQPETIEAPKPLPARDDTSRKGILRRIFRG